ncbi:MAG TPA: membrane protein insertase YidC [Firmicutes bacterium]|nr:membrane protein insertase YidC [Candidatus Fermentithermobacillaceae bacterium]
MSYLVNAMVAVLDFFYGLTSSWGLAIILLTFVVRLIILPLSIMQARANQRLQELQPELQRIQKKYKDDPERLNLELADLYHRYRVNPASGCLVFLVQLPILLGIIRALEAHTALKSATFLGITLGQPERLWLPLITVATTYIAFKLTPSMGGGAQASQQTAMMVALLALMFFFSFRFSAAVALYIIAANVFGLFERLVVPVPGSDKEGVSAREKRGGQREDS